MGRRFLFLTMFATALTLSNQAPVAGAGENTPLVIGAVYNLEGSQAELDIPSSQGARLAVEEVMRNGGVGGRSVQLILGDGKSDPFIVKEKTAEILKRFPSTLALMGLSDTDMVLAAAPVAAESKRLFLTSGATSPRLTTQVPRYLFLACFGDNVQAAAGAEWAFKDLSARTASVLFNSVGVRLLAADVGNIQNLAIRCAHYAIRLNQILRNTHHLLAVGRQIVDMLPVLLHRPAVPVRSLVERIREVDASVRPFP